MKTEPIHFPEINVRFCTVSIVDGKKIYSECEETLSALDIDDGEALLRLGQEFLDYVDKMHKAGASSEVDRQIELELEKSVARADD